MAKNIFVYGSLMYKQVWQRIVSGTYQQECALLTGYQRVAIKGESYPALIKNTQQQVKGIVYFDVSEDDLSKLNAFEGEYYQLHQTQCLGDKGQSVVVYCYLFKEKYSGLLLDREWDKHRFESEQLDAFINNYLGFNEV